MAQADGYGQGYVLTDNGMNTTEPERGHQFGLPVRMAALAGAFAVDRVLWQNGTTGFSWLSVIGSAGRNHWAIIEQHGQISHKDKDAMLNRKQPPDDLQPDPPTYRQPDDILSCKCYRPRAGTSACRLTGPFIEIRQAEADGGKHRRALPTSRHCK